jgi:hypothetical protein
MQVLGDGPRRLMYDLELERRFPARPASAASTASYEPHAPMRQWTHTGWGSSSAAPAAAARGAYDAPPPPPPPRQYEVRRRE